MLLDHSLNRVLYTYTGCSPEGPALLLGPVFGIVKYSNTSHVPCSNVGLWLIEAMLFVAWKPRFTPLT